MSVLPAWAREGACDGAVSGQPSRVCTHADHEGGVDDMGLLSVRISKSHKSTPSPADDPGQESEDGAPGYYFKDMCAGVGEPTPLCQTKDPEGEVDKLMADMSIPAGINKTELKAHWVRVLKDDVPLVPQASIQATVMTCDQATIGFVAYVVAIPVEIIVGKVGPKVATRMIENLPRDAVGDLTEEAAKMLSAATKMNQAAAVWDTFKTFWRLTGLGAFIKAARQVLTLRDAIIAGGTMGAQIAALLASDGVAFIAEIALKIGTITGLASTVYDCCVACGDAEPWNTVRAKTGFCKGSL